MTNEVKWNERFNIGVEVVDKAHRKLFSIVQRLINLSEDEKRSKWACAEGIKYFKSYTIKHFAEEEEYMRSIQYSGYAMHKRLHDDLRKNKLPALEQDLVDSDYSAESVQHFLGICLGWLTGHIMIEDRAITGKTATRWDEAKIGDNMTVLENTIVHAVHETFKLDTRLVSEHYSGEDFGKVVVYRMSYRSAEGKQLQVFWVLEEKLLMLTVGAMLDIKFVRVDKLVTDATKQLCQQLMRRIAVNFDKTDQYKFEKDHLMTKEQLEQEFNAGNPYYSLLFDTGIGYFAFCVKKRS